VDTSLKEFWVETPWQIIALGHNLSAYERKRAYLNVDGRAFLEISHLTGADNDGDGRSVVPADFSNTGRLDLIVRQVGGGPLLLYENRFPQRHYLKVSLHGSSPRSNRAGVGARLSAVVRKLDKNSKSDAPRTLVREMFPSNTYRSQAPNIVHFGLGDAEVVDRLTIRWPSGRVQELRDIAADRHIIIDEEKEGAEAIQTIVPGRVAMP
jgi:hypothetical protein